MNDFPPIMVIINGEDVKVGKGESLQQSRSFTKHARDTRFVSFIVNGGLIVVVLDDADFEVHNPATKQICVVLRCGFVLVMFCTQLRIMEVYISTTHMWRKYDLTLDAEVMTSGHKWRSYGYVVCNESGVLCLYVLTNKFRGIAIKFEDSTNSEISQYCFPLPEVVVGNYLNNSRIWECENSLCLSYYNDTGLWIWKAGCTQVDAWAWVPMLEINRARQRCKPVAREHLSKLVLDTRTRVRVLACHPDVAVICRAMEARSAETREKLRKANGAPHN
ncbi:hypothetical protein KSS87_002311 [Heliosperma pusillum]|nr:hypothetical protein KSS87_002311 [Heliosperma pusillum]